VFLDHPIVDVWAECHWQAKARDEGNPPHEPGFCFPHKNGAWSSILGLADPSAVGNPSLAGGSYLEVTGNGNVESNGE
jgi:hypothetical protein